MNLATAGVGMRNCVRIEAATNGYVVVYDDPDIEERNRSDAPGFEDPEVQVVAESEESVARILAKVLPKIKKADPGIQFTEAFEEAIKGESY